MKEDKSYFNMQTYVVNKHVKNEYKLKITNNDNVFIKRALNYTKRNNYNWRMNKFEDTKMIIRSRKIEEGQTIQLLKEKTQKNKQ